MAVLVTFGLLLGLLSCGDDETGGELSLVFMQDARGGTLDTAAGELTLAGTNPAITYFSDRPNRIAGQMSLTELIANWDDYFGDDPPNAGLQTVDASGTMRPVVIELLEAPTDAGGGTVTYRVRPIGSSTTSSEPISLRDVSLFIDAADASSASLGSGAPASAPVSGQLYLEVENRSGQFQDIVVYQLPDDLGVPTAQPLAWLTLPAWPGSKLIFRWSLRYSFVWGLASMLRPGVVFAAQESAPADPNDPLSNQIQFDEREGGLTFVPSSEPGAQVGSLSVRELAGVPPNIAAVGIGMSNAPVFAVPAQPDTNLEFRPNPQYWIAAGTFTAGEVLDPGQITGAARVTFDGTNRVKVRLTPSGAWEFDE